MMVEKLGFIRDKIQFCIIMMLKVGLNHPDNSECPIVQNGIYENILAPVKNCFILENIDGVTSV
jgi:hypothetical protein